MLEFFREMFDVMTFYRPVRLVAEERRGIADSLSKLAVVFIVFSAASLVLTAAVSFPEILGPLQAKCFVLLSLFTLIIVHMPFAAGAVFLASRLFTRSGGFPQLLSVSYFLAASASIFILVYFIPFAEVAGLLFIVLGTALYLYFLNESFEQLFGVSHAKSLLLLIVYLLVLAGFAFVALRLGGFTM